MQERRIAANRVYTSPRDYVGNHILTIRDGIVADIEPLTTEQARTEWLGGIIIVTPAQHIHPGTIDSIADFYTDSQGQEHHDTRQDTKSLKAYHIQGVASDWFDHYPSWTDTRPTITKL
jgi:hypothetical protein